LFSLGRKDHDRHERRWATRSTGEAGTWLVLGSPLTRGLSGGAGPVTFDVRRATADPAETPVIEARFRPAGAGLAGLSRGLSRLAPIVICSSMTTKVDLDDD
jgi:hypothetical protein